MEQTMIRTVTKQDATSIAKIYNHYIENTTITFEEICISSVDISERIQKVINAQLPWLVIEKNGVLLGYAYATPWKERSAYRFSVEVSVYLSLQAQGKGFGSKLYHALFAELRKLPIHAVLAGISLPNPASIALHEKLGMAQVAHFPQIGRKFDQWLDTVYWQIIFDQ